MKNLLLTLVILLGGITYAQECYPDCPPEEIPIQFNFNPDDCAVDYDILYSDEITEVKEIVALFFTELAAYNDLRHNYPTASSYPYRDIEANDYNTVDVDFYPFTGSLSGAAANATTCNGDAIHIEVNSDKWFTELANEESENNQGNPALPRLKKKFVIYHELGHAVLNLDHNCDTEVDQFAEIMKTTQCPISTGSQYNLSFPWDFPVFQDNDFNNKAKRMWGKINQVDFPACESSSSSSAAATYPSQTTAAAQAPREYYEGETDLEYYGDTDLTNDQLQNRIDAIDNLSNTFVTIKYGWESLNQKYTILLTDLLYEPIVSEIAAVANLTTLTFDEFWDLRQWTIDWRNDFISKIADNN